MRFLPGRKINKFFSFILLYQKVAHGCMLPSKKYMIIGNEKVVEFIIVIGYLSNIIK